MNRHVHADKIIAKAENMDLVVFVKAIPWVVPDVPPGSQDLTPRFYVCEDGALPAQADKDYFLCLPQHKEACLQWLSGNMVEVFRNDEWLLVSNSDTRWHSKSVFMNSKTSIRIKPKKEKRWIGVYGNHVTDGMYPTKELCEKYVSRSAKFKHCAPEGWQFIEIEFGV